MPAHRILHVLGTADLAGKAICRIVEDLAAGLDPEKYRIEACFLRSGEFIERFTSRGIKSTCIDWSGSATDPLGAARYASLLLSGKFDLIHQHTGGRFLTQMSRTVASARIVRHVHGRAFEDTGEVPASVSLPPNDATIANSRITADICSDPNAVVIYPGVDLNEYRPASTASERRIVGTACRLEPVKAISTLIEAMTLVANDHPSVHLEIAGEGSLRNSLEQDVGRLGIAGNVSFLGWREDLPSVLRSWSIFVLPSLDEGFGVAALEAMASGLPVVASDVGGLRELMQDGETGFLVPPEAPAEFAKKIRLLLENQELREKMGSAGRNRAEEDFSISTMVKKTADLYDALLEPGRNSLQS